ncbi:MAG: hypothetical protein HONBIEJF_00858 [Fimbriimonadaceae bacterium]|nr:hypothetical protein [Fimbriimonadaceae bacterium]
MPRSLVYSNGRLLVAFDERGRIRDLFYPRIGQWNHLSGHAIKFGYWIEGRFQWADQVADRNQAYGSDARVGRQSWTSEQIGLTVTIDEWIEPGDDRFIRMVTIQNDGSEDRELRFFSSHDFRINETDIGDTSFYHAASHSLIHYKDRVYLRIHIEGEGIELDQWACGIKGFGGLEGTWRDAEDGQLSMNPIAQGSVDSTCGWTVRVPARASSSFRWILTAAPDLPAVVEPRNGTEFIPWHDPSGQEPLDRMFDLSLSMLRAHIDSGGAVMAAIDSDIMETNRANYAYMWPRDGSFVALVLDRTGRSDYSRKFFNLCRSLIRDDQPFLLQKYHADGAWGATWHPWIVDGKAEVPFQQDESALMIHALGEHAKLLPDDPELDLLFQDLVCPMADHLVAYRDPETGLPLPSYDLWEERRGVHTFTVAAVIAGLRSACQMAEAVGQEPRAAWLEAANEIEDGLATRLWDPDRGCFYRRLAADGSPDRTIDASTLVVGLLHVFRGNHSDLLRSSYEAVRKALRVHSAVGGFARYEGDYYFRKSDGYPGNPWIISTLWVAQAAIRFGELDEARRWIDWTVRHASPTGMLPEQLHPETGEPLSVSPLTWSHAEFVQTILEYRAATS